MIFQMVISCGHVKEETRVCIYIFNQILGDAWNYNVYTAVHSSEEKSYGEQWSDSPYGLPHWSTLSYHPERTGNTPQLQDPSGTQRDGVPQKVPGGTGEASDWRAGASTKFFVFMFTTFTWTNDNQMQTLVTHLDGENKLRCMTTITYI